MGSTAKAVCKKAMQAPTQSGQAASSVVRLERKRKRTKDCSRGRGSKFPKEEKPFFFFLRLLPSLQREALSLNQRGRKLTVSMEEPGDCLVFK